MNNYPKCILALLITFLSHAVQAQPTGKWGISARHKSGYITEGVGATVVDKSGSVFAAAIFTGDTVSFGSITLTRSIRGAGTQTIVVTKADSNGHYIWAKMIGAGYYSSVFSIAVDGYGCLYVYGTYRDSCNVDTFHLRNTYTTASANFLARISPTGNVLWAHNICAGEYQGTIGVDGANNIYLQGAYTASTVVIGGYTIPAYGGGDIYIAKINPAGGVLWARSFGGRSWETQNGIYQGKRKRRMTRVLSKNVRR
ncbi:MAG: hypothetical protein EBZ77_17030 [Chitinophagia bacterium]|nr:hypothetical protein [Chitinophagia bacterium]